jgi:predicted enzyme related to lactoylglutathione lyase
MSERDWYEPGTPCWVDHGSADPEGAATFYRGMFGWETADAMPPDAPGRYFMCSLRGKQVAAIGSQPQEGVPAMWNTYIATASADETAAKVREAGGSVLMEPFDVFDAGRMSVFADPAGAVFCVWQAGGTRGAQLVNEPGALCWNELTTRDADGAKAFYGTVFGWRGLGMDAGGMDYTVWNLAGEGEPTMEAAVGGMMPMVGDMWPADLPSHWMVYFAVEDTDTATARCEELGGKTSVAPFDSPAGRIAVLNDSVGGVFSVITIPDRPAA